MVALAGPVKGTGELYLTGKNIGGVTVNGEVAMSGRSVFSGSTVITPADADATIILGESGTVRLAPNTTFTVSFEEGQIAGSLITGKVTVVSSKNSVVVSMDNGKTVSLNAGETAAAGNAKAQDDDDSSGGGNAWIVWALVFGGAAAAIILAASTNNNDLNLGGGTTVVSPTR